MRGKSRRHWTQIAFARDAEVRNEGSNAPEKSRVESEITLRLELYDSKVAAKGKGLLRGRGG
jgi:hypothetical protein